MPSQTFAFEPKGPRRLEVSWGAFWKDITVKYDGKQIGTFADQKDLKAGREFGLPDGSRVHIQLLTTLLSVELHVLRNGQPLPGSSTDPAVRHQAAYSVIFFIAGINIVLGVIAILSRSEFLSRIGISEISILFGVIFAALGYFTRKGSSLALWLAILFFGADTVLGLVSATTQGYEPSTAGILSRIFLLLPMIQAISAMREMQVKNLFLK